jgi:hypothetical protein
MLRRAANYFATVPPVFLDGLIYVLLSMTTTWMGIMSSESARQFVGVVWLFWINSFLVTANAGLLALKMFRSTSYSDHQNQKQKQQGKNDNTQTSF